MRIGRILILAFLLLPAQVWAQDGQPGHDPDVMRRCQSFSDCALVWDGCADAAVNKKYVHSVAQSSICKKSIEHNPSALPTCTDDMCVVVVRNKHK